MKPTLDQIPSISPHYRFQWEEVQICYVLLYPEGMVQLNGSAGEILNQCDGKKSVQQIIEMLNKKFEANLERDILNFLEHAIEQKWLVYDA